MSEARYHVKVKKIFMGMLFMGAAVCENRLLQFSSFVPAFVVEGPDSFNYGSFPFINQLDPYVESKNDGNEGLSQRTQRNSHSQISSNFDFIQNFPNIGQSYKQSQQNTPEISYGSTNQYAPYISSNNNFNTQSCPSPRQNIGGICRCPNDGIFLSNICFPRSSSPNSNIDPNYGNNNGYSNNNNLSRDCKEPRIYINGQCVCPNDGVFLSGKCYLRNRAQFPTEEIGQITNYNSKEALKIIFRDYDGKNNNLYYPDWGSKYSLLERRGWAKYADGKDKPVWNLPNPRELSNQYAHFNFSQPHRSRNKVTMAFVIWGQFLDHDIDLTEAGRQQPMNIEIPYGDKFFKNQPYIQFFRSKRSHKSSPYSPRQFQNQITSWIDGSQVYGSSEVQARYLRLFKNGKMRTSSYDKLLPRVNNESNPHNLFLAGDSRANQNVILTSYHTIFVREHNRVCDQLIRDYPHMNDEELYQAARHFVIGLLQKISISDFLPVMLGIEYNQYFGNYYQYKPHLNPNIPIQFSTAAYRVGHSLIMDTFHMIDRYGRQYDNLKLRDLFFHPEFISDEKIDDIFRGLCINLMKEKSPELVDELRNLLVLDPENREVKLDLFSLNIQRARDHGLPSYNEARKAYGLRKVQYFQEIIDDPVKVEVLKRMYKNKIDDVQLLVGIWSEPPVLGGTLGELGCIIIGQTFRNLRDGDRFWYQNAYPPNVIQQIKNTKFSDIIKRNTNVRNIQDDIFHFYG